MSDEQEHYEVLPRKELIRRYHSPDEPRPVIKLNPAKVPSALRALIPLAERWGISDDILREEYVARATPEELKELRDAVKQHRQQLNDWLGGPEADNPPFSPEYLAFTHMFMASDGM